MKTRFADFFTNVFFILVIGLAIIIATSWTDDSLVYRLLYEGI